MCDLISCCCVAAGERLHIQRGEQTKTFTYHVHLVGRTKRYRSLHITDWYSIFCCLCSSNFLGGRGRTLVFDICQESGADMPSNL